jgi:hypothetical protein
MSERSIEHTSCTFCNGSQFAPLRLVHFEVNACRSCMLRLGRLLLEAPETLFLLWPALAEPEDEDEPEPKVRRADGSTVELRQVTAELKRELPIEKRMQLAETYGSLGMFREQVIECGYVLVNATATDLLQRAVNVLFTRPLCVRDTVEQLRAVLLPS